MFPCSPFMVAGSVVVKGGATEVEGDGLLVETGEEQERLAALCSGSAELFDFRAAGDGLFRVLPAREFR